jgi:type I restriction enzyme S subunit
MGKWAEIQIKEIATVKGGKRLPKGAELSERPTPYPYVRVTDVRDGRVNAKNILYVPVEVQSKIGRYTISEDDVFISIVGTIGLVAKVPRELSGANLTENAAKISCDPERVDHRYLRYLLQSPQGQSVLIAAEK